MDFRGDYLALERKFIEQVEKDRDLGMESTFVPNMEPAGPVDFVLIAMEPSTGVPGAANPRSIGDSKKKNINFLWSAEDFIFHYCVRKYLCESSQTYHLTDLSKGSMTVRDAGAERERRYKRWFPLLKEELRLVDKPNSTRIIAIGNVVRYFLKKKCLCDSIESVLHYTRTAAGHRKRKVAEVWCAKYGKEAAGEWISHYKEFCEEIDGDEFEATVRCVLVKAEMDESVISHRLSGPGNRARLTDPRKMLMFYYKLTFEYLRHLEDIVLRLHKGRV